LIGSFEKRLMTITSFELLIFTFPPSPFPLLELLPTNKHCPQDTFQTLQSVFFLGHEKLKFITIQNRR